MTRHLLALLLSLVPVLTTAGTDAAVAKIAAKLRVDPADVAPGPIAGLYQVTLGPQVVYVSGDGKYLLRGDILDLKDGTDLTRVQRQAARLAYIQHMAADDLIVFKTPHPRHVLTVLTDIDCQYCRAIARDQSTLLAAGVELRYIAYPRAGVGSESWDKAVAVWCAKDRQTAYQAAMRDQSYTGGKCDGAAVAAGYDFAQKLALGGTPIIITETGKLIDGYLPATQLIQLLDDPSLQSQMDD